MSFNLVRLKFSMLGTVALIIAVSTLGLGAILAATGSFNLYSLIMLVAIFNIGQWLIAPYLINGLYGVRPLPTEEKPYLHNMVESLSAKSGIKKPKLMISKLNIPNAFAYGSPLTGNHVAITEGLISNLETEEIEAVIGHELGHIKHKDVQVMMFVSFLPSLFYFLARSTMFSRYYNRDRRDSGGLALIGGVSMLVYFVLILFSLGLSRLREYYADQHVISIVGDGARKLSEGLAKITTTTWKTRNIRHRNVRVNGYKALFISDPDRVAKDTLELRNFYNSEDEELVRNIMNRKLTPMATLGELFSTHPNIVKRLKALNI